MTELKGSVNTLSDEQIENIATRKAYQYKSMVSLTVKERDALCNTVRVLKAENERLTTELREVTAARNRLISGRFIQTTTETLKPCPFCGGPAEQRLADGPRRGFIGCFSCMIGTPFNVPYGARERAQWNARADASAPTPLCAVHKRLEDADTLECEIGNDCVACSLNERRELLALIAPFAAEGNTEDSVSVLRRVVDFYENHAAPASTVAPQERSDSCASVNDAIGLNLFRQLVGGKNSLRTLGVFSCNQAEHEDVDCKCFWEQCEEWAKQDATLAPIEQRICAKCGKLREGVTAGTFLCRYCFSTESAPASPVAPQEQSIDPIGDFVECVWNLTSDRDGWSRLTLRGLIENFARQTAPAAPSRHYFCSCGGALTAEEYIEHHFEKGHDRGEPVLLAKAAAAEIYDLDRPTLDEIQSVILKCCFAEGEDT